MAWHIISTSPKAETCKVVSKEIVMYENCLEYFIDDGDELIYGKFLCEACLEQQLKK